MLELARLKVYNPHILHHILQTRHEFQVRRILVQIVMPVLFVLELGDEAVAERSLTSQVSNARSFRDEGRGNDYL